MLAELFENETAEKSLTEILDNALGRMHLPQANPDKHLFNSREGGFNLFLTPYACVLRTFPSQKNCDIKTPSNFRFTGHQYHPRTLPPIGIVDYQFYTLALMPGVQHAESESNSLEVDLENDFSYGSDLHLYNTGLINQKEILLDTIDVIDTIDYSTHHQKDLIEPLIEAHKRFHALQQSFYDAWTGQKPFTEFWQDMTTAKEEGLLIDGWNKSPHINRLEIIKAKHYAREYEKEIYTAHSWLDHTPPPPQEALLQ